MLILTRSRPILGAAAAAAVILIGGCGASGGGSPTAASTPVLPSTSSAPQSAGATGATGTSGTPSSSPTSASTGCVNATVTDTIRAALVVADKRPAAIEQPGETYYGTCGSQGYAVASFEPGTTATPAQDIAFQDHGAFPEFFTNAGSAGWQLVGSADGPPGVPSCAAFTQAPAALRSIWRDCPPLPTQTAHATPSASPSTSTSSSAGAACAAFAAHTFAQLISATAGPDDTATATAHPATVSCGGPDDHHYVIGTQSEMIQLPTSAHISVLNGTTDVPATDRQLAASLATHGPGVFQISGPIIAGESGRTLRRLHRSRRGRAAVQLDVAGQHASARHRGDQSDSGAGIAGEQQRSRLHRGCRRSNLEQRGGHIPGAMVSAAV